MPSLVRGKAIPHGVQLAAGVMFFASVWKLRGCLFVWGLEAWPIKVCTCFVNLYCKNLNTEFPACCETQNLNH